MCKGIEVMGKTAVPETGQTNSEYRKPHLNQSRNTQAEISGKLEQENLKYWSVTMCHITALACSGETQLNSLGIMLSLIPVHAWWIFWPHIIYAMCHTNISWTCSANFHGKLTFTLCQGWAIASFPLLSVTLAGGVPHLLGWGPCQSDKFHISRKCPQVHEFMLILITSTPFTK